jgi:hypothetical protein
MRMKFAKRFVIGHCRCFVLQRDPIYAALLTQLQALLTAPYTMQVVSRGFVPWDQADLQPALYIVPLTEDTTSKRGMPNTTLFKIDLYLYVRWTDSVAQGVTALAQQMDAVGYILDPLGPNGGFHNDNGVVNNLGGLAQWCALQGTAEISGGFLNKSQTIARMPLEIMVA